MKKLRFEKNKTMSYPNWERKTLDEIANVYQPQTISTDKFTNNGYPVYGANGIIGTYSKYNHDKDQVLVSCRGEKCGTVNFSYGKSWITGNTMVINVDENLNIDKKYLFYQLSYQNLRYLISGSGQPQIVGNVLNKHLINIPIKVEQEKIGGFLSTFDKLIEKQNEKIGLLKELKKGYLHKMFPKNDANVPEIRFKGFTDSWEQCELSDIIKDFIVPMRDKPKEFGGKIPWTRIEDIEGKYLNGTKSNQYVSESTVKMMNLKIIPRNSLIVSASATFGIVAIVNTDLITNQTFIGLVPKQDYDIDFLYYLFYSDYVVRQMTLKSVGSTIFYISRDQFKNLLISTPKLDEQVRIGKTLSSIDNLITLHQHKLYQLENLKKGYIQRLFA